MVQYTMSLLVSICFLPFHKEELQKTSVPAKPCEQLIIYNGVRLWYNLLKLLFCVFNIIPPDKIGGQSPP